MNIFRKFNTTQVEVEEKMHVLETRQECKHIPNKQKIGVIDEAMNVYSRMSFRISTGKLNKYLLDVIERTPPPSTKGKYIKIKYITQLPTKKPSFVFFCNLPQYVKESYKRFLENKIRNEYSFTGVPIQLFFRKK